MGPMATRRHAPARPRPNLRTIGLLLAGAAALLFAACGDPAGASPLAMVQHSSDATAAAKTARISMTMDGGQLNNVSFDGIFDFAADRMQMTLDAGELGIPGATGEVEVIADFGEAAFQYVRFPGLAEMLGGKSWMKMDLAAALKTVCPDVDLTALLQAQSGDPTSGLEMLEGAERVTHLGDAEVRGERTEHYQVVVNLKKAADNAPAAEREAMRMFADMYTSPEQTADVWLDEQGRVRRYAQSIDFASMKLPSCLSSASEQEANPFKGATKFTVEMYDFDAAPGVELPPESDVADMADVLADL